MKPVDENEKKSNADDAEAPPPSKVGKKKNPHIVCTFFFFWSGYGFYLVPSLNLILVLFIFVLCE